jgi:hypothetical protein
MSTREHIGAVGQWGVPHCVSCGSECKLWDVGVWGTTIGEIFVWHCRSCIGDELHWYWELVNDGGLIIAAYTAQDAGETWEWCMAGGPKP